MSDALRRLFIKRIEDDAERRRPRSHGDRGNEIEEPKIEGCASGADQGISVGRNDIPSYL